MPDLPTSLAPLDGGWSGETFVAEVAGERTVVRIYAGRSASRGPLAPEADAALLQLVAPVLPVPRVLEARRGAPDADVPGLLVCSWIEGVRLEEVLPNLGVEQAAHVGTRLGRLLGRLGLVLQPRAGFFRDASLVADGELPELPDWVAQHRDRLPDDLCAGLDDLVGEADDLLAEDPRRVLVHGDLNPENVLVDPGTLEVTALLDWEHAHAGHPWADLGNLLRHLEPDEPGRALVDAALAAYATLVPDVPRDVLARAEAADLPALVELAARPDETPPVDLARRRLRTLLEGVREGHGLGWTWREAGA